MEALLSLSGVGVPTASTLLYFAFPALYPILDVRALESLGVKPRSQYPITFWLGYLEACRALAVRCRRLDPHAGQGAVAVVQGALGGSSALTADGGVRAEGVEPPRACAHRHLKPACLPFHHAREASRGL